MFEISFTRIDFLENHLKSFDYTLTKTKHYDLLEKYFGCIKSNYRFKREVKVYDDYYTVVLYKYPNGHLKPEEQIVFNNEELYLFKKTNKARKNPNPFPCSHFSYQR